MTVADVKVQTLKLMGLNSEDISPAILPDLYADENYTDYLSQMPPAITRALNRIKTAGAVPQKSYSADALAENKRIAKYDLNALISDFSKLRRVIIESAVGYCGNYPYTFEGVYVVLFGLRIGQTVTFIYDPKMPVITTLTPDSTEIPLPDELAALLPYFVKADVYEQDEPELATQARNIFELMLAEYIPQEQNVESEIASVYTQGW